MLQKTKNSHCRQQVHEEISHWCYILAVWQQVHCQLSQGPAAETTTFHCTTPDHAQALAMPSFPKHKPHVKSKPSLIQIKVAHHTLIKNAKSKKFSTLCTGSTRSTSRSSRSNRSSSCTSEYKF
jgi:hypothetical protein